MKPFVLTPSAERDLNEIWDYIASDSLDAADRVLAALEETFDRLAGQPGLGHYREEFADRTVRFTSVYSYLVVYRWEPRPLQILRILHGARDVENILNDSE
jgi:plasmid stabilization system protein ParE